MRCKCCDVLLEQTNADDLCPVCASEGHYAAVELTESIEDMSESMTDLEYFLYRVEKSDLRKSWSDGLGLMDPQKRVRMLETDAYWRYVDYRRMGLSQPMAFTKACNLAGRRTNTEESLW